jgi:hypothetical protein
MGCWATLSEERTNIDTAVASSAVSSDAAGSGMITLWAAARDGNPLSTRNAMSPICALTAAAGELRPDIMEKGLKIGISTR